MSGLLNLLDASAAATKYQLAYNHHKFLNNPEEAAHIKPKLDAAKQRVKDLTKPVITAIGEVFEAADDVVTTGDTKKAKKLMKKGASQLKDALEAVEEFVETRDTTKANKWLNPTFFNKAGVVDLNTDNAGKLVGVILLAALELIGRAVLLPFVAIYELFRACSENESVNMNPYMDTFRQTVTLEA